MSSSAEMLAVIGLSILVLAGGVVGDDDPNGEVQVPSCPENEHYTNDTTCLLTCANKDQPCDDNSCLITGCACDDGYVRQNDDATGPCILESECAPTCGENEVASNCAIARLSQSCESIYTDNSCENNDCSPGCNCIDGYLRNSIGYCIPSDECGNDPSGCNGDFNATHVDCGSPCDGTCAEPNTDGQCIEVCEVNACKCNEGYILDTPDGVCIKPEDCPGGSPTCGENQTYVECIACKTSYCPQNDDRGIVACSIAYPCPGGCDCISGYLTLSYEDNQCIESSECPPVECTRPNEVWDPKPTKCYFESCNEKNATCDDPDSTKPRCVCEDGYYRNDSDICVPESECPQPCEGDPNASLQQNPSGCPLTCAESDPAKPCAEESPSEGCVCNLGYILSEVGGKCIQTDECKADPQCNGDRNATFMEDPSPCQATCEQPDIGACTNSCMPDGCVCKPGYFLTEETNGTCIKPEDCPGGSPTCGVNETYVECTACKSNYCPQSDDRGIIVCSVAYPCPGGCDCKSGYLTLSFEDTQCIESSECPPVECTRPNEVFDPNPTRCYFERCDDTDTNCDDDLSKKPRCVCEDGYYRNDSDICVPESECPGQGCNGDPNASLQQYPSGCPLTCTESDPAKPCAEESPSEGCVCNSGYILSEVGGKCIDPNECQAEPQCNGDRNATYEECRSSCQASCERPDVEECIEVCLPDGCVCKPGYILSEETNGTCIKPEDCPGGSPTCGVNQTYIQCIACKTNYCPQSDSRGIVACSMAYPCPGGCDCSSGYLSLSYEDDQCIESSECPPIECTRPNEVFDPKPTKCFFESCDDKDATCDDPESTKPRCVCEDGYYRNQSDICVPESECPQGCGGDPNAYLSGCLSACPATCANKDDDTECIEVCNGAGCACNPGYVIGNDGLCIKAEDCPAEPQCFGDRNATYRECASACEASCDNPDIQACITACMPATCQCKPGYLRLSEKGPCVMPEDCPGGSPTCPTNETYGYSDLGCPSSYCPVDDGLGTVVCDYFFPAPRGCVCNDGYLRISNINDSCILASECPPVECTRPNEEWNPSPPSCLFERCDNKDMCCDIEDGQNTTLPPRCVCEGGYYRNQSEICVPESECPAECGQNAQFSFCPNAFQPTCGEQSSDEENSTDCQPAGCVCKPGFLLSEEGGECIDPEDCSATSKPKCGLNEKAVECRTICPPQNCEIAYTDYACTNDTKICEPGCDCLTDYLRNGSGICIPNNECPYPSIPMCGINEIARDCRRICPPQSCKSKNALFRCKEDIACERGCDCVVNYLRDSSGKCVRSEDCPPLCSVSVKCMRTCAQPNPPDCPYSPPAQNIDGCDCQEGYILSKIGGNCIKIEECPSDEGCNGDPNAIAKQCPQPCPSTCDAPNASPCKRMCDPIACECNPGYILSNETGQCILPDSCPGGNPCGENGQFVQCKYECPQDYCPMDDSRAIIACDPIPICLSGCICDLNNKRKSYDDPQCIVSSDCPPVECTRPNEIWNSCPSACLRENCEDVDDQPTACNTLVLNCQPACVCEENYFRNATDICIPADDCCSQGSEEEDDED